MGIIATMQKYLFEIDYFYPYILPQTPVSNLTPAPIGVQ